MLSHHDRQIIVATLRALADEVEVTPSSGHSDMRAYGYVRAYPGTVFADLADAFEKNASHLQEEGRSDLLTRAVEKQVEGSPIYSFAEGLRKRANSCEELRAEGLISNGHSRRTASLQGKALTYDHAAELFEDAFNGSDLATTTPRTSEDA